MRKTHLIALLCAIFSTLLLNAQPFTAEYQYVGKNNYGTSTAVIHDANNDPEAIYMTSYQFDIGAFPRPRCVITHVDPATGSVINAIERDTSVTVERIFATYDRHILVVSLFIERLVVTKYDMSLSEVWSTELLHAGTEGNRGRMNIDLEKVLTKTSEGDDVHYSEDYYIAYNVYSEYTTYPNTDYCPKVVRIDEAGNVIWEKVYENKLNRTPVLQDNTCAITSFLNENEERRLAIAGGFNTWLSGAKLFTFLIDEAGDLQSNYVQITTGDTQPFLPDIMADQDGQLLNIVYTEENSGAINPAAGSNNASGVGIIQLSFDLQNVLQGKYFWHECENYGNNMTISTAGGEYFVSGWAGRCLAQQTSRLPSPFMMKLDPSLSQIYYKQYFTYTSGGPNHSMHTTDMQDNNYILSRIATFTPWPHQLISTDLRLIKADLNGETCEANGFEMEEISFEPVLEEIEYTAIDENTWANTAMSTTGVGPNKTVCVYRGQKPTTVKETGYKSVKAAVTPTLVQSRSTEQLQCSIQSPADGNIEIVIHNQVGQEIYRKQQAAVAGNTIINIDAAVLSTGLNIVRIISNSQVVNTSKVVVAD